MSRFLLIICTLLLGLNCLHTQEQRPRSHFSPLPMAGLCSGDCVSCGCPPALAASGDCCCVRTRLLRHPSPQLVLAESIAPLDTGTAALRCAPCHSSSELAPLPGTEVPLLAAAIVTPVPPASTRSHFPEPLCSGAFRTSPPPFPPPQASRPTLSPSA